MALHTYTSLSIPKKGFSASIILHEVVTQNKLNK